MKKQLKIAQTGGQSTSVRRPAKMPFLQPVSHNPVTDALFEPHNEPRGQMAAVATIQKLVGNPVIRYYGESDQPEQLHAEHFADGSKRPYYNSVTREMTLNPYSRENYIAEAAHAYQQNRTGALVLGGPLDWAYQAKALLTGQVDESMYKNPSTVEYEAHQVIEPKLQRLHDHISADPGQRQAPLLKIGKKQQGGGMPPELMAEPVIAEKGEYYQDVTGGLKQVSTDAPSHDEPELIVGGQSRRAPAGKGGVVLGDAARILSASQEQINAGDRAANQPDAVIKIKRAEAEELAKGLGLDLSVNGSLSPSKLFERLRGARDDRAETLLKGADGDEGGVGKPYRTASLEVTMAQAAALPTDEALFNMVYGIQEGKKQLALIDESGNLAQQGGAVSTEGYRNTSPDRNNAYNVIPLNDTGLIDMDDVDRSLLLMGNGGEVQLVKPNSGQYKFPDSDSVLEIPVAQQGGQALSFAQGLNDRQRAKYNRYLNTFQTNPDDLTTEELSDFVALSQTVAHHPDTVNLGDRINDLMGNPRLSPLRPLPIAGSDYTRPSSGSSPRPLQTIIEEGVGNPVLGGEIPTPVSGRSSRPAGGPARTSIQTPATPGDAPDWSMFDQHGLGVMPIETLPVPTADSNLSATINPARGPQLVPSSVTTGPSSVGGSEQLPVYENPYKLDPTQLLSDGLMFIDALNKTPNQLQQVDAPVIRTPRINERMGMQALGDAAYQLSQNNDGSTLGNARQVAAQAEFYKGAADYLGNVQQQNANLEVQELNANAQAAYQAQIQNNQYMQTFDQQNKMADEAQRAQLFESIKSMQSKVLQSEQEERNYNSFRSVFGKNFVVLPDGTIAHKQGEKVILNGGSSRLSPATGMGAGKTKTKLDAAGNLLGTEKTQESLSPEQSELLRLRILQQQGKVTRQQGGSTRFVLL